MIATECHKLVNDNYVDPIFKEWTPSDYDMRHRYNTPRRLKKLESVKAKEDAKLKVIYDREVAKKAEVHAIIDEIATYPTEVSELFLSTFKWTIDDIVKKHEAYLKAKEELVKKYGEIIANNIWSLKYLIEQQRWESSWTGNRGRYVTHILIDVDDDKWNNWTNSNYATYYKEFKNVKDRRELFADYKQLKFLRDADDVNAYGTEAYPMAIRHMTETLSRILDDIKKIFGDSKPTQCLTDATWGQDGHFNGLLTDGTKKVNFLSFGAGGYNVQKFHFRFKITELKH